MLGVLAVNKDDNQDDKMPNTVIRGMWDVVTKQRTDRYLRRQYIPCLKDDGSYQRPPIVLAF